MNRAEKGVKYNERTGKYEVDWDWMMKKATEYEDMKEDQYPTPEQFIEHSWKDYGPILWL